MKNNPCLSLLNLLVVFQIGLVNGQVADITTKDEASFSRFSYSVISNHSKDSVAILLKVSDEAGNFVSGMANPQKQHEYFRALIDSSKKEICKDFTVTEITKDKSPVQLNFAIVLDYSSSMKDRYRNMQTAVQQFISSMSKAYFTRVNFDDSIHIVDETPTQTPTPVFRDDYLQYGHSTAVFAAIDEGILTLKDAPGARFVIVFSDGQDNASAGVFDRASNPAAVVARAHQHNTAIYALGFDLDEKAPIADICSYTGGKSFSIKKKEELLPSFNKIKANIFSRFYYIQARCKSDPMALRVEKPDGSVKTLVPVKMTKNWLDPDSYHIGFGRIQFDVNVDVIRDDQKKRLQAMTKRIKERMVQDPTLKIQIQGHASPEGSTPEKHLELSQRRAAQVYEYIISQINDDGLEKRISHVGFGDTKPIYPIDSELNPENRRVEIRGTH
jgi:outer membrane protein OmpA-like peptidoglycan-associated protein/uncharacterized alkaline shock family protein YloU